MNMSSILLGVVYRPPNYHQDMQLCDILRAAARKTATYVFIAGDFNYPEIDWETFRWPQSANDFLELVLDSNWSQVVTSPTRGDNTLDLIFTTTPETVISVTTEEPLGDSDHAMIVANLSLVGSNKKHNQPRNAHFDWDKADWSCYCAVLQRPSWPEFYESGDVDTILQNILNSIWTACVASVPRKRKKHTGRAIWETAAVRLARKERRSTEREYQRHKSDDNRRKRNKSSNHLKQVIKKAVLEFEQRIATSPDSKVFWKYVHSKQRPHSPVGPLRNPHTNRITDDPKECAELIAECYAGIFTVEDQNVPSPSPLTSTSITTIEFTPAMLRRHLKSKRNHASPGLDGVKYLLLKRGGYFLLHQLAIFFQFCLKNGATPEQWKTASVIPLFKKGDRTSPVNYRPVSLTSCIAKLMESCIRERLWNFWNFHSLIRPSQFGFIPNSSCCDQLVEFLEDITRITYGGSWVDVVYLDFAKTFNSVPHKRLLAKLSAMGVKDELLNLLKSFIFNRREVVTVLGQHSSPSKMSSGDLFLAPFCLLRIPMI